MTKLQAQQALGEMYTIMQLDTDEKERIIFAEKYLSAQDETPEKELQQHVSDIAYSLGTSFGFSYTIMDKACGIVSELADLNTDGGEGYYEQIDNAVPVYNYELMQIYQNDWQVVDKVEQTENNDSIQRAQAGWYSIIDTATLKLIEMLNENYE